MSIKMLVMDVDGTLTDGHIYVGSNGEIMKAFDVKDGYGIVNLHHYGITPVIITGRKSDIVAARAKELKITEVYQGVHDKLSLLKQIIEKYQITSEEVAYIGDDLNDLDCIHYCGLTACPKDAYHKVKSEVNYVCAYDGGRGAVRDFIDYIVTK